MRLNHLLQNRLNQLNGWQRLWVLISFLYLLLITPFLWVIISDLIVVSGCEILPDNVFCDLIPSKIDIFGNIPELVKVLFTSFFIWAVPLAFVYITGWLIGWVYRGFRGRP